jgi:hypothetical protein
VLSLVELFSCICGGLILVKRRFILLMLGLGKESILLLLHCLVTSLIC